MAAAYSRQLNFAGYVGFSIMTGYDVQNWEYARKKAEELGIEIKPSGDVLEMKRIKDGKLYGISRTVGEALSFLHGYDWARSEYT